MGSTVKKVAKVAIVAAAAYYGGSALMSAYGGGAAVASNSMMTTLAAGGAGTAAAGMSMSTALSIGGMGMQAMGNIQSMKYQKQQSGLQAQQVEMKNKSDAAAGRYKALLSKRSRIENMRVARIKQGGIEAATAGAGLGATGTSAFTGAIGSIGTQTSANLGAINVAEGYGSTIGQYNLAAANLGSAANTAGSNASMWTETASLGNDLFEGSDQISNLFKG